ncbi:MAG: ATP-binding protein [Candidatus Woesearchaeota archaeon]
MLSNKPIEELCRKLRPILGEQIEKIYLKYSLSTDRDERLEAEKLVHALYHKHLGKSLLSDEILLEPPRKEQAEAEYELGTVVYADRDLYNFGFREKDWIRHMCVTGMSGSGKTTFAYTILGNMIIKKKPFLVFDWKRSFRSVLKVDKTSFVFPVGNENIKNYFRVNINIPPPGVGPKQWITIIADLLSEAYQTSYGVHKIITETMHEIFKEFDVYEGSGNYPNWYQIKERLEEKDRILGEKRSSREYEWVTSALRIAHELTFGSFGEVINYKGNDLIDISELMKHRIVFELDGLSNAEKKFFTNFILTYIYKEKKSDPENLCNDFRNLILVDEAHNIFLKERPNFLEESITERMFREIREYGVGLICLDQHVSKLSDVVSGNSACNIAFQQQLPEDIRSISSLMQLDDRYENKRKYFSMLPVGQAIVKLAERYNNPFLIKAKFIDAKKLRVNDEALEIELENRIKNIAKKELKESRIASEFQIIEYHAKKQDYEKKRKPVINHIQKDLVIFMTSLIDKGFGLKNIRTEMIKQGYKHGDINVAITNITYDKYVKAHQNELLNKSSSQIIKELSKEQIDALEKLGRHTYTTSGLYRALQLSSRKGTELKKSLQRLGLIGVIEEKTHKGMSKKIFLTPKGIELLEKAGIPLI